MDETTGPVCVLGAGTAGRGVTRACLIAGHEVRLYGSDALGEAVGGVRDRLDDGDGPNAEAAAAFDRLCATDDLAAAVDGAAVVVAAGPEDLDRERAVLSEAEAHAPETALLASHTASLPVSSVAAALETPGRAVGLHFLDPIPRAPLVEVVRAEQTAARTRERAEAFVEGLDRTAITVDDVPGFATSRLDAAQGAEAIRMLQEGVASPREIDAGMEVGHGHAMGPLERGDVVGLDVRLAVLERLREELGERFRPPALLRRKVRAGRLGRKTGEGFYVWDDGARVGASRGTTSD